MKRPKHVALSAIDWKSISEITIKEHGRVIACFSKVEPSDRLHMPETEPYAHPSKSSHPDAQ